MSYREMTFEERLSEIKEWFKSGEDKLPLTIFSAKCQLRVNWLIQEIERLQGEVERLRSDITQQNITDVELLECKLAVVEKERDDFEWHYKDRVKRLGAMLTEKEKLEAENARLTNYKNVDDYLKHFNSSTLTEAMLEAHNIEMERDKLKERVDKILKALNQKERDVVAISGLGQSYLVLSKLEDFQ